MPYLIGTDEAGYGPNIGPLTISGTQWKTGRIETDLYQTLEAIVSPLPDRERITIADSKVVYQSSGSIRGLETSVLSVIASKTKQFPRDWKDLFSLLCGDKTLERLLKEPWCSSAKLELPIAADVDQITTLGDKLAKEMERNEVELCDMRCRAIFPAEFNDAVERLGNKATILSAETLRLAARMAWELDEPYKIVCDKHGGRSKYAGMLMEFVTDQFVTTDIESLEKSSYRWENECGPCEANFVARGESFLPTALASMISKYVREIFMKLWNQFWQLRIPDLRPTKGYPVDAKRFKKDIALAQAELGISDHVIWRNR